MQKRVIFGIVFTVIALDCYIKQYTLTNGKPLMPDQMEQKSDHKLLQKLKKA